MLVVYFQTGNVGLYIIIALVVLVILACIGYCVYKQLNKKPEPRTNDPERGIHEAVPPEDTDKK